MIQFSAAAALVKVTINRRSMSAGCSPSQIIRMIRSTSTAVLPLPAAADTRMLLLCSSITFCCSGVKFIPIRYLCSCFFSPVAVLFLRAAGAFSSIFLSDTHSRRAPFALSFHGLLHPLHQRLLIQIFQLSLLIARNTAIETADLFIGAISTSLFIAFLIGIGCYFSV